MYNSTYSLNKNNLHKHHSASESSPVDASERRRQTFWRIYRIPLYEFERKRTNRLFKEIHSLRLCRQVFNTEIARREAIVFHRLGDLRDIDLNSEDEAERPIIPSFSESESSDDNTFLDLEPVVLASSVVRIDQANIFTPINRNSDLRVGDRVRVTNRLSHVSGTVTEPDRLAVVTKVNRVFIHLLTDSGHNIRRIKKNLEPGAATV